MGPVAPERRDAIAVVGDEVTRPLDQEHGGGRVAAVGGIGDGKVAVGGSKQAHRQVAVADVARGGRGDVRGVLRAVTEKLYDAAGVHPRLERRIERQRVGPCARLRRHLPGKVRIPPRHHQLIRRVGPVAAGDVAGGRSPGRGAVETAEVEGGRRIDPVSSEADCPRDLQQREATALFQIPLQVLVGGRLALLDQDGRDSGDDERQDRDREEHLDQRETAMVGRGRDHRGSGSVPVPTAAGL